GGGVGGRCSKLFYNNGDLEINSNKKTEKKDNKNEEKKQKSKTLKTPAQYAGKPRKKKKL
ncbi:hypothetical protein ACNIQY_25425, partial [Escherichia coli]